MSERDLWYGTSGPSDAKIVVVGESWGVEEAQAERPFVGASGTELRRMLAEAGIDPASVLMTNVVAARPAGNEMWRFFHARDTAKADGVVPLRGLHPTEMVRGEIQRLYRQIGTHERHLVIAVGNWSLWALSSHARVSVLRESNRRKLAREDFRFVPTGIGDWRGSMLYMRADRFTDNAVAGAGPQIRLLPIIHPAAILRDWSQRAITVHDLKARVPMALRGDWRPHPEPVFWAPPTFEQARSRMDMWLARADAGHPITLVEDIETARGLITVIGLADSTRFAMAIPFVRRALNGNVGDLDSYWPPDQEVVLLKLLRRINAHPNIKIRNQNFIYDTQYISWWLGVTPRCDFDSMLAQNLLFPGTPKDLATLSSLYCNYHWYWKDDGKEWDTKGSLEDLLTYNCVDTIRTFEICERQESLIAAYGMGRQWDIKKYQYDLCLRMMQRGVKIDTARRGRLTVELADALSQIEARLAYIVPQALIDTKSDKPWWRSASQTAYVFYELLGMQRVMHRKTGNTTVGKDALKTLRKKYPFFRRVFDLLDDYGSGDNIATVIKMPLDSDGRVRCSYNPAGTETHRLSSSKNVRGGGTNLQNLTTGRDDDE